MFLRLHRLEILHVIFLDEHLQSKHHLFFVKVIHFLLATSVNLRPCSLSFCVVLQRVVLATQHRNTLEKEEDH